jgi:hypothetical protein
MKIEDESTGTQIQKVWVTLSEHEARTLLDHLIALFEDEPILRPWHMHLEDGAVELNIDLGDE